MARVDAVSGLGCRKGLGVRGENRGGFLISKLGMNPVCLWGMRIMNVAHMMEVGCENLLVVSKVKYM
jgi:hypothetical protein